MVGFILLALIGFGVPLSGIFHEKNLERCSGSTRGAEKSIDLNINLIDENGSFIVFKDLVASFNLVYFGYSFCPDICPIDLGRNVEVNAVLNDKYKKLSTFFVTVDPERDTSDRLKEYTDLLDESLIGLTGSAEQIDIAKKNFMVYSSKGISDENYLVDHTTFTYLIDGEGNLLRYFKRQDTPSEIKETIECLIEKAQNKNGFIKK